MREKITKTRLVVFGLNGQARKEEPEKADVVASSYRDYVRFLI